MHVTVPRVLSVNAGFMDTAAFLALKGLFTAHVTGNFVTLGAALVTGASGALAKLLALPVSASWSCWSACSPTHFALVRVPSQVPCWRRNSG
jgi:uncharacterized membrane protein YoaK (UPF0700 family)